MSSRRYPPTNRDIFYENEDVEEVIDDDKDEPLVVPSRRKPPPSNVTAAAAALAATYDDDEGNVSEGAIGGQDEEMLVMPPTPRTVKKGAGPGHYHQGNLLGFQTSVKTGAYNTPSLNKDALHESLRLLISALRQRRDLEEKVSFATPFGEKIFIPGEKRSIGRFHIQPNCGPSGWYTYSVV